LAAKPKEAPESDLALIMRLTGMLWVLVEVEVEHCPNCLGPDHKCWEAKCKNGSNS
jgi:hypothetical protein